MLGGKILKNHLFFPWKASVNTAACSSPGFEGGETKAEKLFFIRNRVWLVKIQPHALFWRLLTRLIRSDLFSWPGGHGQTPLYLLIPLQLPLCAWAPGWSIPAFLTHNTHCWACNFSRKMHSRLKHDWRRVSSGANLLLPVAKLNLTIS